MLAIIAAAASIAAAPAPPSATCQLVALQPPREDAGLRDWSRQSLAACRPGDIVALIGDADATVLRLARMVCDFRYQIVLSGGGGGLPSGACVYFGAVREDRSAR